MLLFQNILILLEGVKLSVPPKMTPKQPPFFKVGQTFWKGGGEKKHFSMCT